MSRILVLGGSPSRSSRTTRLLARAGEILAARGHEVSTLEVRDLPPPALLHGDADEPTIRKAIASLSAVRGVVIGSPVYKAAYSGLLKTFLDLLPQFALAGKTVLPLLTGGTVAHVLAIDYALRPVLSSLGVRHATTGLFVLDKQIELDEQGAVILAPELAPRLDAVIDEFLAAIESSDTVLRAPVHTNTAIA